MYSVAWQNVEHIGQDIGWFFSDQKLRDELFIGIVKQTAKLLSFK